MITFVNKMLERILLILKTKNLSASQFADEINVQRSSISHILSGRNNPSLEFILKIIKQFPEIDIEWLILGKGQMVKKAQTIPFVPKEVDLFSTEPIITESKNEMQEDLELFEPINSKTIDEKSIEKMVMKENDEDKIISPKTSTHIEKIVFFNSDRTFTEYYPKD